MARKKTNKAAKSDTVPVHVPAPAPAPVPVPAPEEFSVSITAAEGCAPIDPAQDESASDGSYELLSESDLPRSPSSEESYDVVTRPQTPDMPEAWDFNRLLLNVASEHSLARLSMVMPANTAEITWNAIEAATSQVAATTAYVVSETATTANRVFEPKTVATNITNSVASTALETYSSASNIAHDIFIRRHQIYERFIGNAQYYAKKILYFSSRVMLAESDFTAELESRGVPTAVQSIIPGLLPLKLLWSVSAAAHTNKIATELRFDREVKILMATHINDLRSSEEGDLVVVEQIIAQTQKRTHARSQSF